MSDDKCRPSGENGGNCFSAVIFLLKIPEEVKLFAGQFIMFVGGICLQETMFHRLIAKYSIAGTSWNETVMWSCSKSEFQVISVVLTELFLAGGSYHEL